MIPKPLAALVLWAPTAVDLPDYETYTADAKTPMMVALCSECGRPLLRLANWLPAPESVEEAARGLGAQLCVAAADSLWRWCPFTVPPTLQVH